MAGVSIAVLQGQLPQIIQLVQLGIASVRSLIAAIREADPGADVPDDAELIRVFADNSAEGVAEADALLARLRAAAEAATASLQARKLGETKGEQTDR